MLTARRLYLYGVSAAGLGLLLAGLVSLLRLLFDQLGFEPTGETLITPAIDRTREDLSLAIALTFVGLPLWLGHTWYTERMVRNGGAAAEVERRSVLRAVFFTLALGATLWAGAVSSADVLREGLRNLSGTRLDYYADVAGSLAIAVVALLAWSYLAWTRARDVRAGPMTGASAWISRLELYGAVLVGAIAALFALSDLIATGLSVAVGREPLAGGTDWWVAPVTASIAQGLVGGLVWVGHWRYAGSLVAPDHPWVVEERGSRVRVACSMWLIVACVGVVVVALAAAVGSVLAWGLGVAGYDDPARLIQDVVGPPLSTIPFVVAWWWHRRRAVGEGFAFGGESRRSSTDRLVELLVSLVGLAFAGVAAARTLGIALDVALGGPSAVLGLEEVWRHDVSQFAGYAIVATPIWLAAWYRVQTRTAVAPGIEAASTARRAYLVLVGGVTLVAAASSLAVILYETIRVVVGLEAVSLGSDLSGPLGVLVVAIALLGYHAGVLRGDLRVRAGAEAEAREPAGAVAGLVGAGRAEVLAPPVLGVPVGVETTAAPIEATEEVEIVGPAGADFEALNAALRAGLPAGFSLRIRGVHG